MSVRRLSTTARFAVIRESIAAHVGRIADSVEGDDGYDPSGLRVSATDTADGVAVSLGVGAGVATPDPSTALGWSVPLRDASGRRIAAFKDVFPQGWIRALVRTQPVAAPSRLYVFAGITADGPLATATEGWACTLDNDISDNLRAGYFVLEASSWTRSMAGSVLAATYGVHGTIGAPTGALNQTRGFSAVPIPYSTNFLHASAGTGLTDLGGEDPHLIFGVGWSGVPSGADSVTFVPQAQYLPAPDENP